MEIFSSVVYEVMKVSGTEPDYYNDDLMKQTDDLNEAREELDHLRNYGYDSFYIQRVETKVSRLED